MRRELTVAAAAAAIVVAIASGAGGQAAPQSRGAAPAESLSVSGDSQLEARTSAVATQLRCPVCQGLSIQDSPSELAQQMRSLVRDQLAAGKTPDDVKSYFVSKYGEWILLAPPPHGFNLVAYALPILAVVCGGLVIAVAVRRWTAASADGVSAE